MIPDFPKRLKDLRLNYGLGKAQVAKMASVTKNAISTYENGTRQPSFETLIRLSVIYRVSTDFLLGVTNLRIPGKQKQQSMRLSDSSGRRNQIVFSG